MNVYSDFVALDKNRDGFIDLYDFKSTNKFSLTNACLEQIFKGKCRELTSIKKNSMNYIDFVWFSFCEKVFYYNI